MLNNFLERLPADAGKERELVTTAFGISANLREKATAIRSDVALSEVGKATKVKEIAKGSPLQHLRQVSQTVAAMKADIKNLRKSFTPKADRSDVFGEQQRREIRDWLRARPAGERFRAAFENPEIADAVIHAPIPDLTGLTPEQIDRVKANAIEIAHGPQLRGIEKREGLLEVLDAAIEIATSEFRKTGGLTEEEINNG